MTPKCRAMPGIEPALHVPGCEHEASDDAWEGYERDEAEDPDAVYDDNGDDPREDEIDGL